MHSRFLFCCGMHSQKQPALLFRNVDLSTGDIYIVKAEYTIQEIYTRLILYNYCETIMMHMVIHQKDTKHVYQMHYISAAIIKLHPLYGYKSTYCK